MKKKILNIGVYIGAPIAIGSIALGLIFGLKKNKKQELPEENVSKEVAYFKSDILPNMKNALLFPMGGHNLMDQYILLDEVIMDKNSFISKMMQDNQKPEKRFTIDFNKLTGKEGINKGLTNANKKLWDFIKNKKTSNLKTRYGLYWDSNSKSDSIIVSIYKLNDEDIKDKALIDSYIDKLEKSKANDFKEWVSSYVAKSNLFYNENKNFKANNKIIDFVAPMGSFLSLKSNQLMSDFPFMWKWNKNDNGKSNSTFGTKDFSELYEEKLSAATNPKLEKDSKGKTSIIWNDWPKTPVPFEVSYSTNKSLKYQKYYFNKNLIEKKIITSIKPIFEFSNDSTRVSKLKLLFTFYKVDKGSTIDFTKANDIVRNPKNIYSRVIEFNWKDLLDKISTPSEKTQIQSNQNNQNIIFETIKKQWIHFVSIPLVKSGLDLLQQFPSVRRTIKNLVTTFNILKEIKNNPKKIDSKSLLDYIFKVPYDKSNKTLIQKIITSINDSDFVKPNTIFNIWFKDFKGSENSKWTKVDTFSNQNNITELNKMSTSKQVYYFYAGSYLFEPLIRERIKELIKENKIENYYDDISSNEILKFIQSLKDKKILQDRDFNISDLSNETKRNKALSNIIKGFIDGKEIKIPQVLYSLPQIAKYKIIIEELINSNYFVDALKLIFGTTNIEETFNKIWNDPGKEILNQLSKNIKENQELAKNTFASIINSFDNKKQEKLSILKELIDINKLTSSLDQKYQAIIKGFIDGFKTEQDFLNAFSFIEKTNTVYKILLGDSSVKQPTKGLLADIYNKTSDSPLSSLLDSFLDSKSKNVLSKVLKTGLKKSSDEEVSQFINILHKVLSKLPSAIVASDVLDSIKIILNALSPLPTNILEPSKINIKIVNLIKKLI